ncbi:MAG TPA: hypothetical protein VLV82_03720 [Candidatus Angelobacter sp.]|nr:hypothetical protein [Candidatus Angelobacter sp.]
MRLSTRVATGVSAAAVVVLATAVPAMAQDCFNASRSTQGDVAAAAHSGIWWSVPEFLSVVGHFTPEQVARIMPVVDADPRVPDSFTVFYNAQNPGELASGMPAGNAADGHGIDHSDDYSTPVLTAIFQDVHIALS